ncbi:DUF5810 domain-containing protein [Candidatus Halobonum tyrrellensis]|uniref:Uncharacterized protein n=1 Tax=Candidatus Halobonum tyrrellensis G22 TaxID=1324957 RepID=V4HB95_9EURY|nr:DUF5810 domain-containing protein [Candidatus Halobonum tyrrellensis]ESP87293.1 hypothetical protein K933_14443 [Candidatus Halobonum tyrrellensis G22]
MGYACPVCDTPQRDGEHLANHLAFTAMLRSDEHEAWLDEHAPGWGEERPADLADRVTEFADEAAYDEVFEDTVGGGHDHDHSPGAGRGPAAGGAGGAGGAEGAGGFESMADGVVDDAVESVISEAQDLTEEMYGLDGTDGADEDGANGDGTDEAGTDDERGGGTADGDGAADDPARDGDRSDDDDAGA